MRDFMIIPAFRGLRLSHTPGRCAKCGTSDTKRQVIATGIVLSEGVAPGLRGEIEFCDECCKAAGRLVGMVDAARAEADRNSARDANLAKGRLEKKVAKLEAALEALRELEAAE